jgi:ketosteroid isomerase-like protein
MRKIVSFIAVLLCLSVNAQKPVDVVLSQMKEQETAWNKADIHAFMQHYWKSDSLKFITGKGVSYGWQRTLENYQRAFPDKAAMGKLVFTIVEATQLGNDAVYVIGKYELEKEKPASGHFTLLWRLIDRKWVIVSDHTS